MSAADDEYHARYDTYLPVMAENLERLIADHLRDVGGIDRVAARAKTPESFAKKAVATDESGKLKYTEPLSEIQDQFGVRVVVLYLATVESVREVLNRYLTRIEEKQLVPESHWQFGYFGFHSVMAVPTDAVPEGVLPSEAPRFFELQIKTLFQHSWSEANHDLGYKASSPLSGEQERRLAFAAAQAWGADQAFEQLRFEVAEN